MCVEGVCVCRLEPSERREAGGVSLDVFFSSFPFFFLSDAASSRQEREERCSDEDHVHRDGREHEPAPSRPTGFGEGVLLEGESFGEGPNGLGLARSPQRALHQHFAFVVAVSATLQHSVLQHGASRVVWSSSRPAASA